MMLAGVLAAFLLPINALSAEDPGFYLGFGLGAARYDVHARDYDDGSLTSASADTSSRGLRLFGGYDFNPNLALDVFITDLGETTFHGQSLGTASYWCPGAVASRVSVDGLGLAAVGKLPIGQRFNVFAKGGVFAWDWDSLIRDSCGPFQDSDSGVDPMYGAGISYAFNYVTSIQLQWERYSHVIDSHDADLISLGLSFNLVY
jgi:OOP family OmpA-OmpF porin